MEGERGGAGALASFRRCATSVPFVAHRHSAFSPSTRNRCLYKPSSFHPNSENWTGCVESIPELLDRQREGDGIQQVDDLTPVFYSAGFSSR